MSTSKESVPPSEKNEKKNDLDTEKVHSANKWEAVDLGDDDRKKKFLKLMGAAKQEHHGRFVIGDKEPSKAHTRNKCVTRKKYL
ncbi:SMAP-like protein [Mya arenaria]|uniref:Small acidic protein n=1 Tax=Mya arenaria TaxID=6604 RepID=A0ABY7EKI4_MYAAR|nr:SMAP-like protein [Mya arenaria]